MRKVVVSMNLTLDGFTSGPAGELDWHFQSWSAGMLEETSKLISAADTLLLGRVTYQAMAAYWPARIYNCDCSREDVDFTMMMNDCRKIVFSRSLKNCYWKNSSVAKHPLATMIKKLKQTEGKSLLTLGSVQLVNQLSTLDLVDEYYLWVHPVFLTTGKKIFEPGIIPFSMKLGHTRRFSSGVILSVYERLSRYLPVL